MHGAGGGVVTGVASVEWWPRWSGGLGGATPKQNSEHCRLLQTSLRLDRPAANVSSFSSFRHNKTHHKYKFNVSQQVFQAAAGFTLYDSHTTFTNTFSYDCLVWDKCRDNQINLCVKFIM